MPQNNDGKDPSNVKEVKDEVATSTMSPQVELRRIVYKMERDPTLLGMSTLAEDGVLRSWTADHRSVVDAVPLRPALIKAHLDMFPYDPEVEATYKGVDGRTVPQEQWLNPPEKLRPPPVEEKDIKRDEAVLDRNRQLYYERRERDVAGTMPGCPIPVESDHKIF